MPLIFPPISRRSFLGGAFASAAALKAPRLLADSTEPASDRIALLADTHIWEKPTDIHRGVAPTAAFATAVERILALRPLPAWAIIAGDFAFMEGNAGDYQQAVERLRPLRAAGIGVAIALGNHDHRENFGRSGTNGGDAASPVQDKLSAIIETAKCTLFILDSLDRTNVTPGRFDRAQLQWLARELDVRKNKPAVIVAHHDPQPTAAKVTGLIDTAEFYDVIVPRKQVKAYVFGHTHRWGVQKYEGIHLVNLPPTAWVFDPKQPRGWVDARIGDELLSVQLRAFDEQHEKHGEQFDLTYRS